MKANKVVFGAVSIMDISDSTVTPETLGEGEIAYDKSGKKITGTMQRGIDTSDATATASDILSGKTAYVKGKKVPGNIPTKTASNLSASGARVTVPAGYYASQVTKDVATATQATPSISVNSSGLITASATQTAGYVNAGTKSGTKQLTTQAAQTITPGTSDKTIVSGRYLTGAQTIKGDSNLVPENIKSGVSIFGVAGNYEGSGGGSGGGSVETCTLTISGAPGSVTWLVTKYVNGEFVVECQTAINGTHENVVCGSGVYIPGSYLSHAVSAGTVLYRGSGFYYQAPMTPGATVTISLEED